MKMKRSYVLAGIAVTAALIAIFFIGHHVMEMTLADRTATDTITPGLSYSNVVDRLGVMYDSLKPGEYADTDNVIADMPQKDSITRLCVWRIRNSRDFFWVGFDETDAVIAMKIQTR
jgi:hypothetical protein